VIKALAVGPFHLRMQKSLLPYKPHLLHGNARADPGWRPSEPEAQPRIENEIGAILTADKKIAASVPPTGVTQWYCRKKGGAVNSEYGYVR